MDTRSYEADGFLVVDGLVSADEIAELKGEAARICRGAYDIPGIENAPTDESEDTVLARYLCIHHPHKVSSVIQRYVCHPGIAEVLTRLIGPNVKCMQSMLFIKPPGFPGQAYHQDERYIPTEDRSLTGAWIAIDEASIENGCLWVVPGSHSNGIHRWALHDKVEYDGADEAQDIDRSAEIPVEVAAGAVVFFNGYLLHSSLKNRSDRYRRVLVNHYMSAESRLSWVGYDDYRDVMLVAGKDPHAEKGIADISRPHLRARRRG